MASTAWSLSPALMEANQRLHQLREQQYTNKHDSHRKTSDDDSLPWQDGADDKKTGTAVPSIKDLPPHLGWESEAFTKTLRKTQQRKEREKVRHQPLVVEKLVKQTIS